MQMAKRVPLFEIYWDDVDVRRVTEAITSGRNWAIGAEVHEFEQALARYTDNRFCVTFNSGTSGLHAALLAHGVGEGDEVIVPSFTFIATANAPLFVGARPVLADIEEGTYGLAADDIQEKITSRTKAIIPVHYGGCPCRIRELREIADDNGLLLIEDAAESLGATVDGQPVGTFGVAAVLSFCQNKVITTGEGGAVVTNSLPIYERLKLIRSHGRVDDDNYFRANERMDYVTLGYNFRMSNIVAALGIAQLEKVDKLIAMRREKAALLTAKLRRDVSVVIPPNPPNGYHHVYQMYTVEAPQRDDLMRSLADKGIAAKVYFEPVHLTHFYKQVLKYAEKLPTTEEVAQRVVTLPMYPTLGNEDIGFIVDEIKHFYDLQGDDDRARSVL
jgi:perosamine synthetase